MHRQELITIADLRQMLQPDFETGEMRWLPRPLSWFDGDTRACAVWNSRDAGKEAMKSLDKHGYYFGSVGNKSYRASRLIWALFHNTWPVGFIDHINGVRTDNRIKNLRDVSRTENQQNMKRPKNNTSGTIGVNWHAGAGKWVASISVEKKSIYLGLFNTVEEAAAVRREAERVHGFHANHGR